MLRSLSDRVRRWGDAPAAVFFLLPSFVLLVIFSFYPMIKAIQLSFYKWDSLVATPVFTGFNNYARLFASDRFWNSLRVTFTYMLGVTIVSIALGLLIAAVLNYRWLVFSSFWRVLFFLPTVTPTV
ncbi:MAG TPA: sugar ABC transporter permease, partial [Anaerolineaceae bacterium]|nr:sugar ABC transporter permease [Anaerolineaceae bacterium]